MRILHLANVGGESRGGGIHEVAYNFYRYQSSLGISPQLWFPGNKEERDFYSKDQNIKVLDTVGHPNLGFVKQLYTDKHALDFDLIHQHGIWLPISLLSKRFRKSNSGMTILQPHGLLEPFRLEMSKYKKKLAFRLFEKENIDNCRLLLACAKPEAVNLKRMFPKKEVAVIANGVREDFVFSEATLNYEGVFKNKKNMLFLSQIRPLKGLERFLKVIHGIGKDKLKDWSLSIAGFDVGGHENDLKKLVDELGLKDFVKFVGPKFGQEKIDIISNADLFVLPTFNENYGIVVAEALSRSVPVLTTKGTPWSELTKHNCGFWVDNNNQGIKEALLDVLEMDDKELKAMGKRGKDLILSKYTWEKTTINTKVLYEWLLDKGPKPQFVFEGT